MKIHLRYFTEWYGKHSIFSNFYRGNNKLIKKNLLKIKKAA